VDLEYPFVDRYFTVTPRTGSASSEYLDLHGPVEGGEPGEVRYVRLRVEAGD
jgi:hypothetical protein